MVYSVGFFGLKLSTIQANGFYSVMVTLLKCLMLKFENQGKYYVCGFSKSVDCYDYLQSNPAITDTTGTRKSVCITERPY